MDSNGVFIDNYIYIIIHHPFTPLPIVASEAKGASAANNVPSAPEWLGTANAGPKGWHICCRNIWKNISKVMDITGLIYVSEKT
jgi:hypothetical protein